MHLAVDIPVVACIRIRAVFSSVCVCAARPPLDFRDKHHFSLWQSCIEPPPLLPCGGGPLLSFLFVPSPPREIEQGVKEEEEARRRGGSLAINRHTQKEAGYVLRRAAGDRLPLFPHPLMNSGF